MRIILLLLLIPMISLGQDKKSPRVVILNPQEFIVDEVLTDSITNYTLTDEQVQNCIAKRNKDEHRDYIIRMNEFECEFMRTMDAPTDFTFYLNIWMIFKLYGVFDDAIIFPLRRGTGAIDYKTLADEYDINWIVNIRKVKILNEFDGLRAIASIELWNENANEVTLSTDIEIDDKNHAGEMSCQEGTINCIMINGSVYITHQIMKSMFSKKKYWR
ncbi:MAG: hypothetical protein Q8S18_06070 [Bacteroidales bacterium]|nr:hypothetical protein [Bacteroidales bacterium]